MGLRSALITISMSDWSRGFISRSNFRRGMSPAVVVAMPTTWEERRVVGQESWGTPVMYILPTDADTLCTGGEGQRGEMYRQVQQ